MKKLTEFLLEPGVLVISARMEMEDGRDVREYVFPSMIGAKSVSAAASIHVNVIASLGGDVVVVVVGVEGVGVGVGVGVGGVAVGIIIIADGDTDTDADADADGVGVTIVPADAEGVGGASPMVKEMICWVLVPSLRFCTILNVLSPSGTDHGLKTPAASPLIA